MQQATLYAIDGHTVGKPEIPAELLQRGTPDIIAYNGTLYCHAGQGYFYHEARIISLGPVKAAPDPEPEQKPE